MQKTIELHGSRARPLVEWTSRVIPWDNELLVDERTGVKRTAFEELLNEAFAELAGAGYHVTEVRPYPNGFVVLANRVTTGRPAAPQPTVVREDITYYWQNESGTKRRHFTSLTEALQHIAGDVAGEENIPRSLERTTFSVYNREELEDLVATI